MVFRWYCGDDHDNKKTGNLMGTVKVNMACKEINQIRRGGSHIAEFPKYEVGTFAEYQKFSASATSVTSLSMLGAVDYEIEDEMSLVPDPSDVPTTWSDKFIASEVVGIRV
ncbi:hypothetical protein APHAL10511_002189 [Amanita phalloides]|nr:hypothetical protein APHAL10511_002189 [Amanita phalloides]